MKYLVAQGLKSRKVFKRNGVLSGLSEDRDMNMLGEGVKKMYVSPTPSGSSVMQKPLKPLKPLKFKL